MAKRAFKSFAIQAGGTPQPLVGTHLTASVVPGPTDPQGESSVTLPIADSSMFSVGDRAYIVEVGLTLAEARMVLKVPNSTSIVVKGLKNQHTGGAFGTGAFVALQINVNTVYVQTINGNAAGLYIGLQGLVKATFAQVIALLQPIAAPGQPIEFSDAQNFGPDTSESSDYWVDGNTGDSYLPSFGLV
jgi:hypothetical protein